MPTATSNDHVFYIPRTMSSSSSTTKFSSELPTQAAHSRAPSTSRGHWRRRRVMLLSLFIALWIFIAYKIVGPGAMKRGKKPKIIHADRFVASTRKSWQRRLTAPPSYSDKHKYRPAASPVITETLRDGTILLRGAFINPHADHDEL